MIDILSHNGYAVDVFDPYEPEIDTNLTAKLTNADIAAVLVGPPASTRIS